ncbi:hypothetical protein Bhyg_06967 [Pseudolycoriella hygida]|uniref:Uncharacterized protein n=1 Tax=Pseudolycoriella hygida TaxID=35572 RepID=A0A9Q0N392_9DIPT|nr:hypothetical protein Bhyg_06967 [Pseudolycoriella hygida]
MGIFLLSLRNILTFYEIINRHVPNWEICRFTIGHARETYTKLQIDFDDISKPANLANSAVLRMLEEEENQKRHGRQPDASNKRKGRPRIGDIDRATVMSINRKSVCRRRFRLRWPPISRKNKVEDKISFPDKIFSTHNIKGLCRIFDESLSTRSNNNRTPRKNSYKFNAFPIISDMMNCAASNNLNNDSVESINNILATNDSNNQHTFDNNKPHADCIVSIETIKPFSDRKITAINNNNCPRRIDKDQRKSILKRGKSCDSGSEINHRKDTNLHFIEYCEWLRCSSSKELASLQWNNCVFLSEKPQKNLPKNEKLMKTQGHGTDNISGNKHQNFHLNLVQMDFDDFPRDEHLLEYCDIRSFQYSDDENSRIDLEENDLICCNSNGSIKWMQCVDIERQ